MANLRWPPEKTFKYEFNDELAMEIPAIDNDRGIKKGKTKSNVEEKDRG